jgi:hypothetical protein
MTLRDTPPSACTGLVDRSARGERLMRFSSVASGVPSAVGEKVDRA